MLTCRQRETNQVMWHATICIIAYSWKIGKGEIMGYRELLHEAVDELIDERFIEMLYRIAACRIRKGGKDSDRSGNNQEGNNRNCRQR